MSFLDRIAECNAHDLSRFLPFEIDGSSVGWVRRPVAEALSRHGDVFRVHENALVLAEALADFDERSEAVERIVRGLAGEGMISGWRGEYYPVTRDFHAAPLMRLERAAVPMFGIRAYGVHLNGYVRDGDRLKMWVARRARGKQTYPGQLDNMVAGGQPIGLGLMENLVKECGEEAAIPPEIARTARPIGAISYVLETAQGLKPDVLFNYDLELPADFEPRNTDGEVESFHLMPIEEVAALVRDTREFKFNCNLVVIDFLIRHGFIGPEDPDYLKLVRGLHQ